MHQRKFMLQRRFYYLDFELFMGDRWWYICALGRRRYCQVEVIWEMSVYSLLEDLSDAARYRANGKYQIKER